jgi:hypothetical protein
VKLICFPHYTCGGLLCDILNNTFSSVGSHGGLNSVHHSVGKLGIVDSDSVLTQFDHNDFVNGIKKINTSDWIGTHHWPGCIDTSEFEQIIVVSTMTYRSRLYRWIRAYHHYYSNSTPWLELSGPERIDKERETAKNYIIPFDAVHKNKFINIEFSEIVEQSVSFKKLVHTQCHHDYAPHMLRWKKINDFLYHSDVMHSVAANRFHEAELEILQNQHYVYE